MQDHQNYTKKPCLKKTNKQKKKTKKTKQTNSNSHHVIREGRVIKMGWVFSKRVKDMVGL